MFKIVFRDSSLDPKPFSKCPPNHSVFINIKVKCTSPQADALRAGLSFPVTWAVARASKTY